MLKLIREGYEATIGFTQIQNCEVTVDFTQFNFNTGHCGVTYDHTLHDEENEATIGFTQIYNCEVTIDFM